MLLFLSLTKRDALKRFFGLESYKYELFSHILAHNKRRLLGTKEKRRKMRFKMKQLKGTESCFTYERRANTKYYFNITFVTMVSCTKAGAENDIKNLCDAAHNGKFLRSLPFPCSALAARPRNFSSLYTNRVLLRFFTKIVFSWPRGSYWQRSIKMFFLFMIFEQRQKNHFQ